MNIGTHSYAVELDGSQRQGIVDELMRRKKARGSEIPVTEPEIRRFLQAQTTATLEKVWGIIKNKGEK